VTEHLLPVTEVERALVDIGRLIDYPPEPALATAVRRRIQSAPRRSAWESFLDSLRRPAFGAVAIVVITCVFLMASESARIAVADWLGFDDVRITFDEPPERLIGRTLSLGESMSLEEARAEVDFDVLVPKKLGDPDEVYFNPSVSSGMVSLLYAANEELPAAGEEGAGVLITQFEATLRGNDYFTKFAEHDTSVTEVEVRGKRGFWVDMPHVLNFNDAEGVPGAENSRLSGPALLWQEGDLVIRIESALTQAEVIELAESLQ
jgi:hypothetical protein